MLLNCRHRYGGKTSADKTKNSLDGQNKQMSMRQKENIRPKSYVASNERSHISGKRTRNTEHPHNEYNKAENQFSNEKTKKREMLNYNH